MQTINSRTADHEIDPLFLERWSPRAFDGSALSDPEIMTLFEAARWAPSSFNAQPWRFLYAKHGTPAFATFLDCLIPFNQSWAGHASLLIFATSRTMMPGADGKPPSPSHSHSFDTGAAWGYLALQAARMGLQAHGMTGVDFPKAASALHVPSDYRVEAAIAVGRIGDKSVLPDYLQARETPSGREPVATIAIEGGFPAA